MRTGKLDGIEYIYTQDQEDARDAEEAADLASAPARKGAQIRAQRNQLLRSLDWTRLDDSSAADKTKYTQYRQDLRDIPDQVGFPDNVIWPTEP